MNQTTVGKVLTWLEGPTGLTVRENRDQLVGYLNRIREHIYLLYQDVDTAVDLEYCVCISRFCHPCWPCDNSYLGFSLPAEAQGIDAAFAMGRSIQLESRWREVSKGIGGGTECRSHIHYVGQKPLERAPDCCDNSCLKLTFLAKSPQDYGKVIAVTGNNESGEKTTAAVKLGDGGRQAKVGWVSVDSIVAREQLCGGVEIMDGSAKVLAEVGPIMGPVAFSHYRTEGLGEGQVIRVIARRRFADVFFDNDGVETDNRLAFEHFARMFRARDSNDVSGGNMQMAEIHEMKGKDYIYRDAMRQAGKATIRRTNLFASPIRKARLNSRR